MSSTTTRREVAELQDLARRLRRHVLRMTTAAKSGHPGGSLSAAEIVTALYFRVLRHRPQEPHWEERDRFILSKGHAVPIVYAAMAEAGYFPVQELMTLRRINSRLQGHPSVKDLPGIEASTGSLGQGLSIGVGAALAARLDGRPSHTFVVLGDGESQEGQVWEAALAASRYRLDNLTAILDYNKFQLDDAIETIMPIEPVADKWRAFGWETVEIDGHDMAAVVEALEAARAGQGRRGRPLMIVAHTVKGKGVSFMENNNAYHGAAASPEELQRALAELGGTDG